MSNGRELRKTRKGEVVENQQATETTGEEERQMQRTTELQIQAAECKETLDREERQREVDSRREEWQKFQEFMDATLNGRGADRRSTDFLLETTEKIPKFSRTDGPPQQALPEFDKDGKP